MSSDLNQTAPRRIGIRELELRLGVDRATIWRWYRAGKFPAPHFVGERRAWFVGEVEAWEMKQMSRAPEARRGAANLTGGTPPPLPPQR